MTAVGSEREELARCSLLTSCLFSCVKSGWRMNASDTPAALPAAPGEVQDSGLLDVVTASVRSMRFVSSPNHHANVSSKCSSTLKLPSSQMVMIILETGQLQVAPPGHAHAPVMMMAGQVLHWIPTQRILKTGACSAAAPAAPRPSETPHSLRRHRRRACYTFKVRKQPKLAPSGQHTSIELA